MSFKVFVIFVFCHWLVHLIPTGHAAKLNPRATATTVTTTTTVTFTTTKTSIVSSCPTTTKSSTSISDSSPTKTTTSSRLTTTTTTSTIPSSSGDVKQIGCRWQVLGVGTFTNKALYNFTGSSLPSGLMASDYTVQDNTGPDSPAPYNHSFKPSNVALSGGFLNLKVPGAQKPSSSTPISCAEVQTTFKALYGSVRFTGIFSGVPGTCQGAFFYQSDNQEIDIEYLSDSSSLSNNGPKNPIPFWYSNQAIEPGTEATQSSINSPQNPTSGIHEYRIDWTPSFTAFYFDGVEQTRYFDNIPSKPSYFIFNNWANGDKGWSVGPPASDNVFKIKSITMYYNGTEGSSTC